MDSETTWISSVIVRRPYLDYYAVHPERSNVTSCLGRKRVLGSITADL